MSSPVSPRGSLKRHTRNISYPRRPTIGPLDEADHPLTDSSSKPTESLEHSAELTDPQASSESRLKEKTSASIDLSFLQDGRNFHQVPADDIPAIFKTSERQPPAETLLTTLLQDGHFRRAADSAATSLLQCRSDDARAIFELFYIRLACLILVSRPDLAAAEATPLSDFLAHYDHGSEDLFQLIPWELRLLLVRLQSIAATDGGRRGVMALYSLAAEVRVQIQRAIADEAEAEVVTWSRRLQDLGLRVADTLVELGELETAARHLDTLVDVDAGEVAYRKALLRVRMGDVADAERCIDQIDSVSKKTSLGWLIKAANGNFAEAVNAWKDGGDAERNSTLYTSNLAVGLVYTGRIKAAQHTLEELLRREPATQSLLFNLATIYELSTEQAVERKMALADILASMVPSPNSGGWERPSFEFKL